MLTFLKGATATAAAAATDAKASDSTTLWPQNPLFSAEQCLDSFKLNGEQYIRKSSTASTRKIKKKTSAVWVYGEALLRAADMKEVYYCYICECQKKPQRLPVLCGTKGGIDHMTVHGYNREGYKVEPVPTSQKRITSFSSLVTTVDYDVFKRLFMRWIVYCQLAFAILENDYFRELLTFLNAGLASLLPRAAVTLRRWIMDEYADHKERLKDELRHARSDIHLSFDMWTAPNGIAIFSVYGHWISPSGARQSKLLAFRRVFSKHTGEHQGEIIIGVVKEYGIEQRLGFLIGDNIASNDVAVHTILRRLYPNLSIRDRVSRRLRCLGHVVNLCASALILGSGKKGGDKDLDRRAAKGDLEGCHEIWRGRGPVGRLHNIVQYIRWSPQRRDESVTCKKGGSLTEFDQLELLQDNSTRWNSFYTAIGRALTIQERIDLFCRPHKPDNGASGLKKDILTAVHWQQLDKIHDCLKIFEVATLATQGHKPFFFQWYQTLAWLLHELDNWRVQFEEDAEGDHTFKLLSECCMASWLKCEKYYKLADQTPIVYAAIMLDPREKKQWFIDEWSGGSAEQQTWILQVELQVKAIWQASYKPSQASASVAAAGVDTHDREASDDPHQRLYDYMHKRRKTSAYHEPIDQLDAYLSTDPLPRSDNFDPVAYWIERQTSTPQLVKFALDCLAIPCMSDDPEPSFSAGRDLLTYHRNRLSADIIEATQCLRSWYGKSPAEKGRPEEYDPFDDEDIIVNNYNTSSTSSNTSGVVVDS